MPAQIYGLNGQPIENKLPRCEDIARLLESIHKMNEAGELKAIVICSINEDGSTASAIANGKPVAGELFVGALELTKDMVKRNMPRNPWIKQ